MNARVLVMFTDAVLAARAIALCQSVGARLVARSRSLAELEEHADEYVPRAVVVETDDVEALRRTAVTLGVARPIGVLGIVMRGDVPMDVEVYGMATLAFVSARVVRRPSRELRDAFSDRLALTLATPPELGGETVRTQTTPPEY